MAWRAGLTLLPAFPALALLLIHTPLIPAQAGIQSGITQKDESPPARGRAGSISQPSSQELRFAASDAPPEPDSYRTDNFRSPVPTTLKGARVLSTDDAEAVWRGGTAAFIDVLPHPPKPQNLPAGTIWREKPRLNIPGSIWLPDTGYGALAPVTEDYFRRGLDRASGGDRSKLLVFYCLTDCWMSWNAAKRALAWGYSNVAWYPQGTDGWQEADLPLAESKPEPRAGE